MKIKVNKKKGSNKKVVINKNHQYKIHELTPNEIRKGRSNAYTYAL